MSFKPTSVAIGCLLSLSAVAGTMGTIPQEECRPWSVIGSLGYTWYDAAYHGHHQVHQGPLREDLGFGFGFRSDFFGHRAIGDGQTAFGRFAVARELGVFSALHYGAEIGVQSGNTFRFDIPQWVLDPIGGLHPQATIKPMLDFLATATYQSERLPAFGLVKLGVAYRRMQINDRVTFNDLSQAAFEVQAGLGLSVSDRAKLSINYQGVFNGGTRYTVDPIRGTGRVSNIPDQNGLLLSLSYTV